MNDFSARRASARPASDRPSSARSGASVLFLAGASPCRCPSSAFPLWPLLLVLAAGTAVASPASSSSASISPSSVSPVADGVSTASAPVELVAEDDAVEEEEGLLEKVNSLYPIYLDDDLEPEVEDKLIPLWLTSACCGQMCGALWIPMLIVGEDPGVEYFVKEALIAIVVETLTNLVGGAATTVGGIGTVLITANLLYLTPVSIINTYDRALKRQRAKNAESAAHLSSVQRRSSLAMAY